MRVLSICGSPHRNGNTASLLEQVLEGARSRGAETEMVHVNALTIRGCQGCFACKTVSRCVQRDDMQVVYDRISEADAVVFGSPLYCWDVSAQLKAVIDRLFCYLDRDMKGRFPSPKRAALVIAQGNANASAYDGVFATARRAMAVLFEGNEVLVAPGLNDPSGLAGNPDLLARARAMGERLAIG